MTRTNLDSEDTLEQATLALFRQMGCDTVNCMDEVFGVETVHAPSPHPDTSARPNLGRETTRDLLLPRLVSGEVNVENIAIEV